MPLKSANDDEYTSAYWKKEMETLLAWKDSIPDEDFEALTEEPFRKYRHFSGKEDVKRGWHKVEKTVETDILQARSVYEAIEGPSEDDLKTFNAVARRSMNYSRKVQSEIRPERFTKDWTSSPLFFDIKTDKPYLEGVELETKRQAMFEDRSRAASAASSFAPQTSVPAESLPESDTPDKDSNTWTTVPAKTKKGGSIPAASAGSSRGQSRYQKRGGSSRG